MDADSRLKVSLQRCSGTGRKKPEPDPNHIQIWLWISDLTNRPQSLSPTVSSVQLKGSEHSPPVFSLEERPSSRSDWLWGNEPSCVGQCHTWTTGDLILLEVRESVRSPRRGSETWDRDRELKFWSFKPQTETHWTLYNSIYKVLVLLKFWFSWSLCMKHRKVEDEKWILRPRKQPANVY